MNSKGSGEDIDLIPQEDLKKYLALMIESKVEMDPEVLQVVLNLLKLNVPPDEIYSVIRQMAPVCGLFKRFKLKPKNLDQPTPR